jgi:NAD-dependent dihydropyrimidine dehydrogenase PreA subunit
LGAVRAKVASSRVPEGVVAMSKGEYGDIPREEIEWFPRIDKKKCTECGVCMDFCHQEVFAKDEGTDTTEVVSPYSCIVGCTGCMSQCPAGAISFPTLPELRDLLRALRAKYCNG